MRGLVMFFVGMALGAILYFAISRSVDYSQPVDVVVVDSSTSVELDTIRIESVVYRDRWRVRVDTCLLLVVDSVGATNSEEVLIPIDKYVFTDDTSYRAELSGYGVTLDNMEVYNKTISNNVVVHHTTKSKPKPWGLGVQVGYGINPAGKTQPYIGVGVSYNFVRF